MSQDKDDTQNFTDTDEDEKSDNSSSSSAESEGTDHSSMIEVSTMNFSNTGISDVSPGSTRDTNDEDSRRLKSAVEDMRSEDKNTASESPGDITDEDSTKSNSGLGGNQAGCKIQATKRRFPFSNENSESDSNIKKRTVSTSPKQKIEGRKSINSTESNLPLIPVIITPDKFEKKFAATPDEGKEKPKHSSQSSGFYTQNPTTPSSPKQIDALDADKIVDNDRETKISDTPTKRDENLESQSGSEKHATSIKPDEKAGKGARIITITDLNLPPSHVVFSPEKFEKEFSRISDEDNKESSQLSLQQSKLISQNPTSQSLQKQMDDPSFTFGEHKQVDMHQETKILITPTNRRDSLEEDSEHQLDSEKFITSKSEEKAEEDRRITTTTELNLTPSLIDFSPETFENELVRIPLFQHLSQQPKPFSQSPILQSHQKLQDDSSLTVDSAKQSDSHQEENISTTPANRQGLFFDENPDYEKPKEKVVQDSRITTTPKLNLPPVRLIFSPEKFERELTRNSRESDKENPQLSSEQPELSSLNTPPQSPQKQTDNPRLADDSDKQSESHQKEQISTTPTNQRRLFFYDDFEPQPDSEIISKPAEKIGEDSSISTTTELNLPSSRLIFSPERFAREFSRITREETKQNSQLSSQQSKLSSQKAAPQSPQKKHKQMNDPSLTVDSDQKSDAHQEEKISGSPKKRRRISTDENSESKPDFKKDIASTKPIAKVKGYARTTLSGLKLPSFRDVFSPERFEKEFNKTVGTENTQHSSQRSNYQITDQESQNENSTTNSPLIVRLRDPPTNRSSEIDPGEGPSSGRRHVVRRWIRSPPEVEIPPELLSYGREIHFFEIPYIIEQQYQENLFQRVLKITKRLSVLEDLINEFDDLLNKISLSPVSPPRVSTRSHSLAERRASARRYHAKTISYRQKFLSLQPKLEIYRTFLYGMVEILNDIRDDLSIVDDYCYLSYLMWIFKERVEYLFTEFCDNCEDDVISINKEYLVFLEIFIEFSNKVENLFEGF